MSSGIQSRVKPEAVRSEIGAGHQGTLDSHILIAIPHARVGGAVTVAGQRDSFEHHGSGWVYDTARDCAAVGRSRSRLRELAGLLGRSLDPVKMRNVHRLGCRLHPQPQLQSLKLHESTSQQTTLSWLHFLRLSICGDKLLDGNGVVVWLRVSHQGMVEVLVGVVQFSGWNTGQHHAFG